MGLRYKLGKLRIDAGAFHWCPKCRIVVFFGKRKSLCSACRKKREERLGRKAAAEEFKEE